MDNEISQLEAIVESMATLDSCEQQRVLEYLNNRYSNAEDEEGCECCGASSSDCKCGDYPEPDDIHYCHGCDNEAEDCKCKEDHCDVCKLTEDECECEFCDLNDKEDIAKDRNRQITSKTKMRRYKKKRANK